VSYGSRATAAVPQRRWTEEDQKILRDLQEIFGQLVLHRPSITGQCPVWCERTARLYRLDVQQPAHHRFDPSTGVTRKTESHAASARPDCGTTSSRRATAATMSSAR
jgi:sugar lactone lactonase YvrE